MRRFFKEAKHSFKVELDLRLCLTYFTGKALNRVKVVELDDILLSLLADVLQLLQLTAYLSRFCLLFAEYWGGL